MLEGMSKTDLQVISADTGTVLHGMKKTDPGFTGFGEMYFSRINGSESLGVLPIFDVHACLYCCSFSHASIDMSAVYASEVPVTSEWEMGFWAGCCYCRK